MLSTALLFVLLAGVFMFLLRLYDTPGLPEPAGSGWDSRAAAAWEYRT